MRAMAHQTITKLGEEKRGILKELANSTKFMVTGK